MGDASQLPDRLHVGTSSWSSKDWDGVFYPGGMPPSDYLSYYGTRFRTVEVDATFYRIPSTNLTRKWRGDLPEGFLLAAKIPRIITHEKALVDCGDEFTAFLRAMDLLEDRLGPILFQFPYFRKGSEMTEELFRERLTAFLPSLPSGYRFALEIRNKTWLKEPLADLLRGHGVALAIIDHPWMPRAGEYLSKVDPLTAGFAYLRWLGDRYGIEKKTKNWDKVILDRSREMKAWVPVVRSLLSRGATVFGYFNNHYAGHAPASVELFERIWSEEGSR
jgi:uncharacterized protein YecE (DUF72 family)